MTPMFQGFLISIFVYGITLVRKCDLVLQYLHPSRNVTRMSEAYASRRVWTRATRLAR